MFASQDFSSGSTGKNIAGIKFRSFSGLLAFSTLIGLGISEIVVYLIIGENASGTQFSLIYMIAGTILTAYLWKSGNISRNISRIILILSALTGFVFLSRSCPWNSPVWYILCLAPRH